MNRKYVFLIIAILVIGSASMYGAYQYFKVAYIEGPLVESEDGLMIYRWDLKEEILVLDKFKSIKNEIKTKETRHLVDLLLRNGPASLFAKYPERLEIDIPEKELISEEMKREKEMFKVDTRLYEEGKIDKELYEKIKIGYKQEMKRLREDLSEKDLKRLCLQKRGQLYMETMWVGEPEKFLMKYYEVDNPDKAAASFLREEIEAGHIIIYNEDMREEIYRFAGVKGTE